MGNSCSGGGSAIKAQAIAIVPEEPEVPLSFKSYSSSFDKHYTKVEEDYNFLKFFQLYEILILLKNMKVDEPNFQKKTLVQEMDKSKFCVFVDNKILKNYLIYAYVNENEDRTNIFKDFMLDLFDTMLRCSIDLYKYKNPDKKVKKGQISTIKKLSIIALGLLYCQSSNRTKVNFLFNLLQNDDGQFPLNEETEDFLYFLFILPASCSLITIKNLGDKYEKIGAMSEEDFVNTRDSFEVKDVMRLRGIFVNDFFQGQKTLTKDQFEQRFFAQDQEFGWIFSTRGIRTMLEKHNDKPPA